MKYHMESLYQVHVLIDTWWNVNMFVLIVFPARNLVLIDTWWNVNSFIMLANILADVF